jgi:Methyltransferase domain
MQSMRHTLGCKWTTDCMVSPACYRLAAALQVVCGAEFLAVQKDCLVYSIGSKGDDAFEVDLLRRAPNCEVSVDRAAMSCAGHLEGQLWQGDSSHCWRGAR